MKKLNIRNRHPFWEAHKLKHLRKHLARQRVFWPP